MSIYKCVPTFFMWVNGCRRMLRRNRRIHHNVSFSRHTLVKFSGMRVAM